MTEIEQFDVARYEQADEVLTLYMKNYTPIQIVRELKIPRRVVDQHIAEWKENIVGSSIVRDRVEELLAKMDDHFGSLIKELHYTLDAIPANTRDTQMMAQRTSAVKAIAEVTNKRIDALQKAGLLDAADLGDEIAEAERMVAEVLVILREVSSECPVCGPEIKHRTSKIDGHSHGDIVDVEVG